MDGAAGPTVDLEEGIARRRVPRDVDPRPWAVLYSWRAVTCAYSMPWAAPVLPGSVRQRASSSTLGPTGHGFTRSRARRETES